MRKNEIREILHRLDMERKKFLGPKLQVLGLTVGEGQAPCPSHPAGGRNYDPEAAGRSVYARCGYHVPEYWTELEKAGLLKRENNPGCRRSYLICLTEEGEEKAKQVQKIFRELDERIWGDIPEKEMERLYETLARVEKNLEG